MLNIEYKKSESREDEIKSINTNIGEMSIEDYLDMKAWQFGFEDYEDLKKAGYSLI